MNVKQLKEILNTYPDDMQIWISDNGYCEGGTRLEKIEIKDAYEACLDGDEVDDEYIHVDSDIDIEHYLSKGYKLSADNKLLSKKIVYLNDF